MRQSGFITPLLIIILGALLIGGGVFISRINNPSLNQQVQTSTPSPLDQSYWDMRPKYTPPPIKGIPLPSIEPFAPKGDLSDANIYKLTCSENRNSPELAKILSKNESLLYSCLNTDLNQFIFSSSIQTGKVSFDIFFKLYDLKSGKIQQIFKTGGTYWGGCSKIDYWTKDGDVYYECGVGEGGGETSLEKINLKTLTTNTVRRCAYILNDTICSDYCNQDNQCGQNSFCHPQAHACLQKCQTSNDCKAGECWPTSFGFNACW